MRHGARRIKYCSFLDAYKHIHVAEGNVALQCVEWGGKYFIDRSLTFGCSSSPGLYDCVSRVVKEIAIKESGTRRKDTYQCLDDCGLVGSERDAKAFHASYSRVGPEVGVRLAEGADKSFSATTHGEILGIVYNAKTWTWSFSERKFKKLLNELNEIVENDYVDRKLLERVSGKIGHYKAVISPEAKWERGHLLYLATDGKKRSAKSWRSAESQKVKVSKELRDQMSWWCRAMVAAQKEETGIPDVRRWFPNSFVAVYPDAAGGSDTSVGRGFGGVVWEGARPMVYGAWPQHIQLDIKNDEGVKFARKLSLLEGVAALATVAGNAKMLRGRAVRVFTDNAGLYQAFNKAHSRDPYCYTIMMALKDCCRYLGIKISVCWTPRCSSEGEEVADHLSKARFKEAGEVAGVPVELQKVPMTLLKWLERPSVTRLLGYAMLEEMSSDMEILPMEPEDAVEIRRLKWVPASEQRQWRRIM